MSVSLELQPLSPSVAPVPFSPTALVLAPRPPPAPASLASAVAAQVPPAESRVQRRAAAPSRRASERSMQESLLLALAGDNSRGGVQPGFEGLEAGAGPAARARRKTYDPKSVASTHALASMSNHLSSRRQAQAAANDATTHGAASTGLLSSRRAALASSGSGAADTESTAEPAPGARNSRHVSLVADSTVILVAPAPTSTAAHDQNDVVSADLSPPAPDRRSLSPRSPATPDAAAFAAGQPRSSTPEDEGAAVTPLQHDGENADGDRPHSGEPKDDDDDNAQSQSGRSDTSRDVSKMGEAENGTQGAAAPTGGTDAMIEGLAEFDAEEARLAAARDKDGSSDAEKPPSQFALFGARVIAMLDGPWMGLLMTLATLYCLFGDNIRVAGCPPESDGVFVVLSAICLVLFLLEFTAFCLWKQGYAGSFFFWLDVVACLSLIPELPFMWDPFLAAVGGQGAMDEGEATNLAAIRASRASRSGSRAGRLLRMTRLVRFLRMVKLYKYCGETAEERERQQEKEERRRKRARRKERMAAGLGPSDRPGSRGGSSNLSSIEEEGGAGGVSGDGGGVNAGGGGNKTHRLASHGSTGGTGGSFTTDTDTDLDDQTSEDEEAAKRALEKEEWLEEQSVNSEIGRGLSDVITKTVILVVLALLFVLPLLETTVDDHTPALLVDAVELKWNQASSPADLPVNEQNWASSLDQATSLTLLDKVVVDFQNHFGSDLLLLQVVHPTATLDIDVDSLSFFESDEPWPAHVLLHDIIHYDLLAKLRRNEITRLRGTHVQVWMSRREDVKTGALLSIFSTLVVITLISVASALFSKDAADLVLAPIEKMVQFVTTLSANPLAKIKLDKKGGGGGDSKQAAGEALAKLVNPSGPTTRPLETQLLESTFCKLAGLLQIGFGAAGAEIISHNMRGDKLDPLVKGRKVFAIFGFADLRGFAAITEALGGQVMAFANQVAEILHELVHKHHGGSNKNLGNAFLLVWKPSQNQIRRATQMLQQNQQLQQQHQQANLMNGGHAIASPMHGGFMSPTANGGTGSNATIAAALSPHHGGALMGHNLGKPLEDLRLGDTALGARKSALPSPSSPLSPVPMTSTHAADAKLVVPVAARGVTVTSAPTQSSSDESGLQSVDSGGASSKFTRVRHITATALSPPSPRLCARDSSSPAAGESSIGASHHADAASVTTVVIAHSSASVSVPVVANRPPPILRASSVPRPNHHVHLPGASDSAVPPRSSISFRTPLHVSSPVASSPLRINVGRSSHSSPGQPDDADAGAEKNDDEKEPDADEEQDSQGGGAGGAGSGSGGALAVTRGSISSFAGVSPWTVKRRLSQMKQKRPSASAQWAEASSVDEHGNGAGTNLGLLHSPIHRTSIHGLPTSPLANRVPAGRESATGFSLEMPNSRGSYGARTLSVSAMPTDADAAQTAQHHHQVDSSQHSSSGRSSPSSHPSHSGRAGTESATGLPADVAAAVRSPPQLDVNFGPRWETLKQLADDALVAFLQALVAMATVRELDRWRNDPALMALNGGNKFEVNMGFGLHAGWSIEGAIGSALKIDASYLSPNVNIAARLDSSTKQYGVQLLFSGHFRSLLQPDIRARCRHLDRITVKGSSAPIDIYTFDVSPQAMRGQSNSKMIAAVVAAAAAAGGGQADEEKAHTGAGVTPLSPAPSPSAVLDIAPEYPPDHLRPMMRLEDAGVADEASTSNSENSVAAKATLQRMKTARAGAGGLVASSGATAPIAAAPGAGKFVAVAHKIMEGLQGGLKRVTEGHKVAQAPSPRPAAGASTTEKAQEETAADAAASPEPKGPAHASASVAPEPLVVRLHVDESDDASSTAGAIAAPSTVLSSSPISPLASPSRLTVKPPSLRTVSLPQFGSASPVHAGPQSSPSSSGTHTRTLLGATTASPQSSPTHAQSPPAPPTPAPLQHPGSARLALLCATLQIGLPATFVPQYNAAVSLYLRGRWGRARDALEAILQIQPGDGPATKLLQRMREKKFKAPKSWPGYTKLTEK